jgi:predicted secreted Zn-dependent protease
MRFLRFGLTGRRPSSSYRRSLSLLIHVSLLFVLGVAGLCTYIDLNYSPAVDAKSLTPAPAPVLSTYPKTVASTKSSNASVNVSQNTATASSQVPLCVPDETYQTPAKLGLSQPGLQQIIDTPYTYTVYGNTGSEIISQIAQCTPVHSTSGQPGIYAASTAYAINWQFDYVGDGDTCTLSDISVGLHINQVFPAWQPSAGNNSMNASWQSYIAKLHTYESGHVQLDEAAASAVLSDLQNFPPADCDSIVQAATDKVNTDVHYYDVANANYDTDNNYGMNQNITL